MKPPSLTAPGLHAAVRRHAFYLWFIVPFSLVCAAIVTYVIRIGDSFAENAVFSLCIALSAAALIDGGRALLWRNTRPPAIAYAFLVLLAIPVSYIVGDLAAIAILRIPPQNVFAHQANNVSALLVLCVLAAAFATWFLSSRARLAELKAEAEAEKSRAAIVEKQALQAQLQLLQTQIEPHMLFNTLANLQGLIATDAPRAQRMLNRLIEYLRATLSSSRAAHTTFAQEFALMEAYLELMSIRMGARLSSSLHLPEELRDTAIPPMLLQPLVENAIKHGIEPKIEGGRIEIRAARKDDTIEVTVSDTGLGLDRSPDERGMHVGLANIRERLEALFGDRASLSLSPNSPTGAVARLILPS